MAALKKVVLSVVALIIVAAVLFVVFEEEISSYLVGETTTVTGIVISEQMESSREMIPWQAVLVRLRDNSSVEALVVPGCKNQNRRPCCVVNVRAHNRGRKVFHNFRHMYGGAMKYNKSFKFVPGLRPSTGHKTAAQFYAALLRRYVP